MFQVLSVLLAAISLTTGREFENPLIRGVYTSYAGVTYYNGTYYIAPSNDTVSLREQFPIYQSLDLQNWGFAGFIFPTYESLPYWVKKYFYSAEIHVLGENNFRAYFSANSRYRIGVAFATNILGPYIATSQPLIEHPTQSVSDPNLLNDNGVLRLYWRQWDNTIQGRDLTPDGLNVGNGPITTVITPTLMWETSVSSPSVFKANNKYFLFYSTSWNGIGVARSSQPYGPFEKREERILAPKNGRTPSDPSVIRDIDATSWVLIYTEHYYPVNSTGNQYTKVQMAKSLLWDANGWPYV